jgi:uncharacterized protein YjbJ (UPF0337 family)
MNRDQIESDWNQFRGSAKQQWCTPSDDLLDMIAGKRDQLAGKIQETRCSLRRQSHHENPSVA